MRAYALAALFLSTLALAGPVASDPEEAARLAAREKAQSGQVLQARDCVSNGCRCRAGTVQGQYCGWGTAVTNLGNGGALDHVYECNSSGGCCDYGFRADCA